jgi:hypothetical protein
LETIQKPERILNDGGFTWIAARAHPPILESASMQSVFRETLKYSAFPAAQGCAVRIGGCKLARPGWFHG